MINSSLPFSKLGADYLVFVSTFHSMKLSTPNWKIPTLNSFIESLTQEHDKLIQMGIIWSSRDQELVAGGPKVANDKGKQKYESPMEKEQSNEPSGSKRSKKNDKGKTLVLTVEGAFIQKALVWEEKLMRWLFFWRCITLLYLLAQGRMTRRKKLKNMKRHAMHWRLASPQHMPSSLILELPIIWLHPENHSLPCSLSMVLVFKWEIAVKFKPKGRALSSLNMESSKMCFMFPP